MKSIVITFNNVNHTLTANDQGLFNLNDVAKAYNPANPPKPRDHTRSLSESKMSIFAHHKVTGKGKNQGTYMNQDGVIWYASKLSEDFEIAMIQAFRLLTEGKALEAAQVSASVALDMDYANAVAKRWDAFTSWAYVTFKPVNAQYGGNITNATMKAALGLSQVRMVKGESGKDLVSRLVYQQHTDAIHSLDATMTNVNQFMAMPITQQLMASGRDGMKAVYANLKVLLDF